MTQQELKISLAKVEHDIYLLKKILNDFGSVQLPKAEVEKLADKILSGLKEVIDGLPE
jgi:hypothetical protein